MRIAMDRRLNANFGFLIGFFLALLALTTVGAWDARASENLYIRVKSADCSKTKLVIELTGIQQLPKNILLSIDNEKTETNEIKLANVELQGDEYIWTGLIPFGSFRVSVFVPNSKMPLKDSFTNIKLLMPFRDQTSSFIQVRNGNKTPADREAQPLGMPQDISIGPLSPATNKIHLLLIGADNKLAAQYLGPPISLWTPTIPDGGYKLVVIEYDRNESTCSVHKKRS